MRLGTLTAWALFAALPLVAIWYLGATFYFVFHDQLLASLMARQTDMQYGYEDKIATLRTQLDRETSRGLIDRRSLDVAMRDLATRGDELMARAAKIDAIVAQGLRASAHGRMSTDRASLTSLDGSLDLDGAAKPAAPTTDDLRLDRSSLGPPSLEAPQTRSDNATGEANHDVAALFDAVEHAQSAIVVRLREPMVQNVTRLRSALAEMRLPGSKDVGRQDGDGTGGPFVPLPPGVALSSFDANLALLEDAIQQQNRLLRVVDQVPLRRPLEGPLEVTSTFGPRLDPFLGRAAMHTGIDLHEETGDAVEATASGVVTIAGSEGGYGNMVEIDHGSGVATRYAHLSAICVVPHQRVTAGMLVGRVGSTGRATGPHLHYETRINGEPVDPTRFLKAGAELFPG